MGLFGLFKQREQKERKEDRLPDLPLIPVMGLQESQEEPEFLKEIDVAAEREVETAIERGQTTWEASEIIVKDEVESELALWLANGITVRSLKELVAALKKMKNAEYKEQVNEERNDIAEWVREILNNSELADKLEKAKGKMQAAKYIEKEIVRLKAEKKKTQTLAKIASKAEKKPTATKQKMEEPESVGEQGKEGKAIEMLAEEFKLPLLPEIRAESEDEETLKEPLELLKVPELPAPIENGEESKKKSKGFLFFGRRSKKEEKQNETVPEIQEILEVPEQLQAQESQQPEGFEPELHHVQWTKAYNPATIPAAEEVREETKKVEEKITERVKEIIEKEGAEATLDKLGKKEQEIERLEQELNKEEEELNNKRLSLTRRRYELIKQKGELEKKRFEEFMKKQRLIAQREEQSIARQEEGITGITGPATETMGLPDFGLTGAYGKERLQALLEEAKQHISQNNVEEAQRALEQAQSVFSTVYMPQKDKKQMEYELLEVEADLKLATLK